MEYLVNPSRIGFRAAEAVAHSEGKEALAQDEALGTTERSWVKPKGFERGRNGFVDCETSVVMPTTGGRITSDVAALPRRRTTLRTLEMVERISDRIRLCDILLAGGVVFQKR